MATEILDVAKIANAKKKVDNGKASKKTASSEGLRIVKAPDPYPSRAIPLRALEEDDYVEAVSALIERDFFPDLPHLRARYELMQARLRGDNTLAKALEKKLLELPRPTPGGTPRIQTPQPEAGLTNPAGNGGNAAAARLSAWERDDGAESVASAAAGSIANYQQVFLRLISGREVLVDLSTVRLDDFQKVFTSEDNASFEAVLEKDRERRRQKEWWVEGSEEKQNTKCQQQALQFDLEPQSTGEIMTCEFQARNTLYFKPKGEVSEFIEKPTVESRNTRFTTQEQTDLDETLIAAIAARHARESGQQFSEVLAKMVKDGTFSVAALHNYGHVRAVGGRLQTPIGQSGSYPMVNTPTLLPGENGFSPLMTFGKIASTPRVLDEDAGPTFRVQEESARDRAADKLAKGAMQKQRESRQNSKKERLKALGLTPSASPASTRPTPASVASKVTPMTPIGQLLHRAQRMAQRGGRLRISSNRRVTPTPSEGREAKRARTTPVQTSSASIPASLMADLL